MGQLLTKALETAGLAELAQRALAGEGLNAADMGVLRASDLLLVAGLADEVRAKFRGDDVRVARDTRSDPNAVVVSAQASETGATGAELLRDIALTRLATPAAITVAVSFDQLGLELSQTALVFGADMLLGDLGGKRTLPLLDGPSARRQELTGLLARAGRNVLFVDDEPRVREPREPRDAAESSELEQHP